MRPKIKTSRKKDLRRPAFQVRKKICYFCKNNINYIDYKDIKTLERFISERGKILSSRISGNCARHQRLIAKTIKKTRNLALLAYSIAKYR